MNPKKQGPFHFRAPSRILYKAIRGMIPHKTSRGAAALERIKLYEGVPPPYDRKKKMVVPQALRVLRLKPGRKYSTIKRLSHEFGWHHKDVVDRLEEKRKVKAQAFHERKVCCKQDFPNTARSSPKLTMYLSLLQLAAQKARQNAIKSTSELSTVQDKLSAYGY